MDGDELDELVWFHKYEIFSADDRIGNKVCPTVYVSEGQGSMTELVTDHGYPTYVSDNARDIAMVVKAAEATILSDDPYHLFVNRGEKRDSAESNTCATMRGVLGDMGFTRVAKSFPVRGGRCQSSALLLCPGGDRHMNKDWILQEVKERYEDTRQEIKGLLDRYKAGEFDWEGMCLRERSLSGKCDAYAYVIGMLGGSV